MHRIEVSAKLDDLDAGQSFRLYLYENSQEFALLHDQISRDNNEVPFVTLSYVFVPMNITNYYEIYAQKAGANGNLIDGFRANRCFGEKIQ